MANETTKYCEDCALFRSSATGDYCAYPRLNVPGRLLVKRAIAPSLRDAAIERGHETDDSCGRAAKWFQPKSTEQVAA